MRKLYEPYARPLTRIIQGLPTSWDPSITVKKPSSVYPVAWSPCSRFIAVGYGTLIEILDAVTLDRHAIFNSPSGFIQALIFSPDCRLLTLAYLKAGLHLINWDIQTGAPVSVISALEISEPQYPLLVFSACGTVLGVSIPSSDTSTIHIYNVLSGTYMRSHSVGSDFCRIWAHGERLLLATLGSGSITTWEAGFASEYPLTEVESLPTPDNFDLSDRFLFLPTHSRLAFVLGRAVLVWDTQYSKLLLNSVNVGEHWGKMTFSSDGRFFACGTRGPEVYLWKESPTGYVLHHKFVLSTGYSGNPRLSPNGQSIVASSRDTLQLWRTEDSATTLNIPTPAFQPTGLSILEFSLDKSLMATARTMDNTATVFDLKSGVPRLIIDTGMEISGLRVAGNNIVVVDNEKSVTWNLPPGDHVLGVRVNVNDSVRTRIFDRPLPHGLLSTVSISPDLKYFAAVELQEWPNSSLNIYDVATGKRLARTESHLLHMPWFTPDGREVWCSRLDKDWVTGWVIVGDSESSFHKLEGLKRTQHPQDGYPWEFPHNCKFMDDGWILGPSKRRLLWLPHHWRSPGDKIYRVWDGRYLGFLHRELPEAVVLEVLEE